MFINRLCKALNKAKIKYAIVGGWALVLHKIPRATFDIDMVIQLNEKSFLTVEKTFLALGLISRIPIEATQLFKYREEYIENKNLIAWSFYNPINPSEMVDVIITENFKNIKTEVKKLSDVNIPVISVKDLIVMKEKSNRPQDAEDIKWLKKLI